MTLNINTDDEKIILNLIEEGIFSKQQLDEVLSNHKNTLQSLKNGLFNKIISFNPKSGSISVFDGNFNLSGNINIPFEQKPDIKDEDLNIWADTRLVFNDENKKVDDISKSSDSDLMIGISNNNFYFYNPNIESNKYLIRSENYIFGAVSKNKIDTGPFDLYCFSGSNFLVVSDRGAGKIHLIDIKENKFIKSFSIRNPGNTKSINISLSPKKNKFFITDNISTSIFIIDINTYELTSTNPGIGLLGNILVSPNELNLYCITLKPKESLKLLDINNFSVKKDFPVKGNLFSPGDAPYDLLALSPDKKFVYFMTHIPDPELFTPVITVIETDKEKATQRFSIKDGSKIISAGFCENNPLFNENRTIFELLIANDILKQDKLSSVKTKLAEESSNSKLLKDYNIVSNPSLMETLPGRNTFSVDTKDEVKKEETEWKINLTPKKVEFSNITPGIDELLYKTCRDKLMRDYEVMLRDLAEKENWEKVEAEMNIRFKALEDKLNDKDVMISIRLHDAVTKARQELEWHNLSVIRLIELMENYNFEIAFMRDDVLEWIREKERDDLIETGLKTIATNCPNCDAQLLGSYTCRACGFELEKPEDMMRRKLLQVATYHPLENLRQGHLIITDTVNHKVIETDHFRRIIYELKKDVLHSDVQVEMEMPRDAVRLKNNITLVVDYGANRVFKLTQKGRLYWELNYGFSNEHVLKNPISIAALESGNTIIVDYGNHRVIEVDEDQEIVWKYGEMGVPGIGDNQLNFPTFFQRTKGASNLITDSMNNRVIELEGTKIIWQYGNAENVVEDSAGNGENQLNKPLTAWRFENGNTLILDSGNFRVIEVSQDKKIVWEYKINSEDPPIKAFRLKSGKVMVISNKKVIEIDYATKEIAWSSSIDELTNASTETDITTVAENVKKTKVFHGVRNAYTRQVLSEKNEDDKLKSYVDAMRTEMSNRPMTRSPVLLSPNAHVTDRDFIIIDKLKPGVYLIDRKGTRKWEFSHPEMTKPQAVLYNPLTQSVFISDANAKKIFEVDIKSDEIIWSYSDPVLLLPKSIELAESGNLIVSDSIGGRILEISKETSNIAWEYKNLEIVKTPYYAVRLDNGNTLVTDWSSHTVQEISPDKKVIWYYGEAKKSGNGSGLLSYPEHAVRLENGNTLITDSRNGRVIEVSPEKSIVWSTEGDGAHKLMSPLISMRLSDGHTAIIHSGYKQILEVDSNSRFLWKYIHYDRKL